MILHVHVEMYYISVTKGPFTRGNLPSLQLSMQRSSKQVAEQIMGLYQTVQPSRFRREYTDFA